MKELIRHAEDKLEKLKKLDAGEQLSVAATVLPLTSLAEFPGKGDEQLDLYYERKGFRKAVVPCLGYSGKREGK